MRKFFVCFFFGGGEGVGLNAEVFGRRSANQHYTFSCSVR